MLDVYRYYQNDDKLIHHSLAHTVSPKQAYNLARQLGYKKFKEEYPTGELAISKSAEYAYVYQIC